MSHRSFETAVKGATKVKLAPPKTKYIEVILLATQSGEAGVAEIFRTLTNRLRDSTWTVVFKSLVVVHLMIKEGTRDVTLSYLAAAPTHRLAINSFTNVQTQGQNIRRYTDYLVARAKAYEKTHHDYVLLYNRGHFKSLSVDKGLLRESEVVLDQIKILTKCNLMEHEVENELSLTAFRLLTRDLLDLFGVANEAVMNILQHYFEMSRPDAERAVKVYRRFCTCTEHVVTFLRAAQLHANAMRLEIPKIKHAPVDLVTTLQEYLDDKDFDINRRQYLAQQEAKRNGKPTSTAVFSQASSSSSRPPPPTTIVTKSTTTNAPNFTNIPTAQPVGPAPNLIDFFESIEQNQQPIMQSPTLTNYASAGFQPNGQQFIPQQQQQQTAQSFIPQQQTAAFSGNDGFMQQQHFGAVAAANPTGFGGMTAPPEQAYPQTNPYNQSVSPQQAFPQTDPYGQSNGTGLAFAPIQAQPTYGQPNDGGQAFSPIQSQSPYGQPNGAGQAFSPIQPQSTNPFRKSMIQPMATGQVTSPIQAQSTNPYAYASPQPPPPVPQMPQAFQTTQQQPLQAQRTGTNPFAQQMPPQQQNFQAAAPLQMQATGSTNPFRQATFVNQSTGTGWQSAQQPTMGGLEQLPTVPVFPRPGQGEPQSQFQQSSPWG